VGINLNRRENSKSLRSSVPDERNNHQEGDTAGTASAANRKGRGTEVQG